MRLIPFLTILRPANALVAGLSAVLGFLIATGEITPRSLLLFLIVVAITGGGNVINDYVDAAIDAINRPSRPIPSGKIPRWMALWYAAALFCTGLLLCLGTTPLCLGIALLNSLLLVAYAGYLKRTPLIGNLAIAYLTGSIFLFGGSLAGVGGLSRNLLLFSITFLATIARELLKDAEDVEGDASVGAMTVPIWIGIPKTTWLALGCSVAAIMVSLFPGSEWWSGIYLAGILPVDGLILVASLRSLGCTSGSCIRETKSTLLLKAGMFLALAVFCVSAVW